MRTRQRGRSRSMANLLRRRGPGTARRHARPTGNGRADSKSGTPGTAGQPVVSPARPASLDGIPDRLPNQLGVDPAAAPPHDFLLDGLGLAADPRREIPAPSRGRTSPSRPGAQPRRRRSGSRPWISDPGEVLPASPDHDAGQGWGSSVHQPSHRDTSFAFRLHSSGASAVIATERPGRGD